MLRNYHDQEVIQFLAYGWPINFTGSPSPPVIPRNHRGATDHPQEIRKYLQKEVEHKSVIGPFHEIPFSVAMLSPLNTTDKKDSNEKRIIIDHSFRSDGISSVNENIDMNDYFGTSMKLSYPSIDTLVQFVLQVGKGALLYKRDIRRCYRQIPTDPKDAHLLGYHFDNHFYFDISLPMGLSSAAYCAQRTTNMIKFIATEIGLLIANYLDDFGGVSPPTEAMDHYLALGRLLRNSGVEENVDKATPPNERMIFLGILFDSLAMTLSIPPDKLQEIFDLLRTWEHKETMTRHELESLIGKLNHIAQCVRPGRIFIARLLAGLRGLPRKGRFPIDPEMKKDIIWWQRHATLFNGISQIPQAPWGEPNTLISCDATLQGCGGWLEPGHYFREKFPIEIANKHLHISALEMLTLLITVKVWISKCESNRLQIYSDNMATVIAVNTGKSRDPFMNACLRELCYILCKYNCELKVRHISTKLNTFPDLLSRWHSDPNAPAMFAKLTVNRKTKRIRIPKHMFYSFYNW